MEDQEIAGLDFETDVAVDIRSICRSICREEGLLQYALYWVSCYLLYCLIKRFGIEDCFFYESLKLMHAFIKRAIPIDAASNLL